jgi:tetrapyrrole methylase family protein/MazG family protein
MPFLIEETYEVLEALEAESPEEVRSELGDLLLQILLHAEMASERGEFDIRDVIDAVRSKMVRRHPHVFGDLAVAGSHEVLDNWSRIKTEERRAARKDASVLAGVPAALPALLRAERLGEKASRVGFDWSEPSGALAKAREEIAELEQALASGAAGQIESEVGDCLFALVSLARKAGVSAELALKRTLDRFASRFRHVETALEGQGRSARDATLEELEALWQEAKRR